MLICTVSFTFHRTMDVTVHNQYLDIELVSPVYFCNRGTCYKYPIEWTDDGAMTKISFGFDINQDKLRGILVYKVQRKINTGSGHQSSIDTTYTKVVEETSKLMWLLVTWEIGHLEKPKINIMLIEHGNESILNEDKLAQLDDTVHNVPFGHNCFRCTWLMYNNIALEAAYELVRKEEDFELKITISEGVRSLNTIRSIYIDSERQVLLETMIYFY
jgi:hypothetical protein